MTDSLPRRAARPCGTRPGGWIGTLGRSFRLLLLLAVCTSPATAADLDEAEALFRAGKYDECAALSADELADGLWSVRWAALKIESELARGKTAAARATFEMAARRFPESVSLRLLGREVALRGGLVDDAARRLEEIERLIAAAPQRINDAESRVAAGRFFLQKGADAREVLDRFFDPARKEQPAFVDAFFATAELALDKQDEALASETLQKAPPEASRDPRYHYLLARAYSSEDRARSDEALAAALKINPRHADSLLLLADHRIDAERYGEAAEILDRVLAVDPDEPRAWAYRGVLAHLRGDSQAEDATRRRALTRWAKDPVVDHLFGRELSAKYRFAEGAAAQRRSLAFDPAYLPAKVQLCQDLLRLGEEEEGWALAAEAFTEDAYNVQAYNLVTLRDYLKGFRTLEADGLVVRMDPREADLYGRRALELLRRARKVLGEKYGAMPDRVVVEIFPRRKDFAVRTFGLPGAEGFLGVCFGRVITANSPAAQGEHPSNWEAVLWHEFCHAVTLAKTRNKMPRWLSEGISVYEEAREDRSWGESLNPGFRAMLLSDDLTPVSRLSSAFLAPASPLHLQFAYYESALVVEFLVERSGADAVKGLLADLGAGTSIDKALPRRAGMSLEELDRQFARFARGRAEAVARELTWEEPELPEAADSKALRAWLKGHPQSYQGRRRLAARLATESKWVEARDVLEALKAAYPEDVGPENAYVQLASACRHLNDPAAERAALGELTARDGSAGGALLRLLELDEAAGDWGRLASDGRRLLAVNPLVPAPHRAVARAAEHLGHRPEALEAYRALAVLDDSDPAEVHYRLARLLRDDGKPAEARREVLKALEEAPRFREAHRLLLDLVDGEKASTGPETPRDPQHEGPTR